MAAEMAFASDCVWTPARVELLRLHHAIGFSAALSAELIGGVSRNAVISKRRRLGLIGANPLQAALRAAARRFDRSSLRSHRLQGAFLSGEDDEACLPLPDMDLPPPPAADPRTLAQREPGQCAWPLGPAEDPGDFRTLFCGAPTRHGQSFCAAHRSRAYVSPSCEPRR